MPKQTVWSIINPKAGVKSKSSLPSAIRDVFVSELYDLQIYQTEYAGHATLLAQKAIDSKVDLVIVVGGDGTINEVAKALLHSEVELAIVAMGSGNGLARHLGLSLDPVRAIKEIPQLQLNAIDVCFLNESPFLCTAGVGFDAHIAHVFAQLDSRGFISYVKSVFKSYFTYRPAEYTFHNEAGARTENLYLLSIANANQWGNNVFISPKSTINDGAFEVCLLKPFSKFAALRLARHLFRGTIDNYRSYESYSTTGLKIENKGEIQIHLDGEPRLVEGNLFFSIKEQALRVRC